MRAYDIIAHSISNQQDAGVIILHNKIICYRTRVQQERTTQQLNDSNCLVHVQKDAHMISTR